MSDDAAAREPISSAPGTGNSPNVEEVRERIGQQRMLIDASVRVPCLAYIGAGVFWLVAGSALAILASIKLHSPDFLADISWLTFGRVRPAHLNSVAYGWGASTGTGVLIWLMARLSRAPMRFSPALTVSAVIFNLGVALGIVGILNGEGISVEWLEFPWYVPPILALAYVIVALVTLINFVDRREPHVYVTQWYAMGALFWFPWLYTAIYIINFFSPVSGVVHASANWWFAHNVLGLYLTPIGLGTIYYLMPKVLGRPIHSYYLSILGFWSLALFYNWNGAHHLVGGPVPAWLVTISVVASVMMLIPVITVAINHHFTMLGNFGALQFSPTLRFIVFGAMSYTLVSLQGASQSLRMTQEVTHFTHYTIAHAHLGAYSFYSMTLFGALYYIVPRLTNWEWASSKAIKAHFWFCGLGIFLYWLSLTIGGFQQGLKMLDPEIPFLEIVEFMKPYLHFRTVSGTLMTVGHVVFAGLLVMNLLRIGQRRTGPTLLADRQAIEAQPEAHRRSEAFVSTLGS